MYFAAGIHFVLIVLCFFSIDARIAPIRSVDAVVNRGPAIVPLNNVQRRGWDDWEDLIPDELVEGISVCYPVVGCFDNNPPFDNAGLAVPQSPTTIGTSFLLFTKETPTNPEILEYDKNDKSIINSRFNNSRWLRVIVHGFTNNRHSLWIPRLTEELLKLKDKDASDVLVVDWGNGAKFPLYNFASANTRLVGKQISLLLKKMKTLKQLSYDKVHCIGHSLGAHTCGYASIEINRQMGRISGLDPAGPFFEGKTTTVRLDRTHAKFVDVIHSNTEIALSIGLGSKDQSGHIDFYVNGGKQQPGCPSTGTLISGLFSSGNENGFEQASCSHSRSHGYFIESIKSQCPYTAYPCVDFDNFRKGNCLSCTTTGCAQMGFHAIYSLGRGNMYLSTKSNSPFCGYHYYVELALDQNMPKTIGEIFVAIYSNYEMLVNVTMTHKANANIKAGDILRHVFSFNADIGKIDYAVVYFNKGQALLNLGGPYANEVVFSRLTLKSIDSSIVSSTNCNTNVILPANGEHTMLLDRINCNK